jgi:hypothetical protein
MTTIELQTLGELMKTLINNTLKEGYQEISFDASSFHQEHISTR